MNDLQSREWLRSLPGCGKDQPKTFIDGSLDAANGVRSTRSVHHIALWQAHECDPCLNILRRTIERWVAAEMVAMVVCEDCRNGKEALMREGCEGLYFCHHHPDGADKYKQWPICKASSVYAALETEPKGA